jgi:hypothetical protein
MEKIENSRSMQCIPRSFAASTTVDAVGVGGGVVPFPSPSLLPPPPPPQPENHNTDPIKRLARYRMVILPI